MKKDYLKIIFYSMLAIFLLLVTFFAVPSESKNFLFPLVGILGLLFLILGIVLIVLAKKKKGNLKIFLILTGASAISPLVFTILHNLFYALAITFENVSLVFGFLDGASFIISIIIAPICFIIGIIGSIYFFYKKSAKKTKKKKPSL